MDLYQEANIALIKSVEKYDFEKGTKFNTYASTCMRNAVLNFLQTSAKTIRLPKHINEKIAKIKKYEKKFVNKNGVKPTPEEIADNLEMPVEKVEALLQKSKPLLSYDDFKYGKSDDTAHIAIGRIFQEELEDKIKAMFKSMSSREMNILRMYYGFEGKELTQRAIGRVIKLTSERVRQIINRAKEKALECVVSEELRQFYDELE
jgi:RNA polymerase primary sigma factor